MLTRTLLTSVAALAVGTTVGAATTTWTGATDSDYGTGSNWDTAAVPVLDGTDDAVISNGDTVVYNATALGDIIVNAGSTLAINGGSTWQQTPTNWSQINGGTLALDNGTFSRTGGGNLVLGFNDGDDATVTLDNGAAISVGGEVWFGHVGTTTNQVVSVTIGGGSSITATGSVGVWFWDTDTTGNDFNLNFISGTEVSSVNGRVGRRNSASTDNAVTWETLWAEGILTVDGGNAGAFSDHFTTSGTPGVTDYSLQTIPVPEPGSLALLGLGTLMIARRRRA